MWMREVLLGIFLGGCAWTDSRKKEVSLLWLLLFASAGSFYLFTGMWGAGLWEFEVECIKRLGGIFCGLFLLAASVLSKGQVGIGDGLVFLVCGLFLDFWESSLLLMGGLFLLCGRYIVEILWKVLHRNRHGNKERGQEQPLLPYIFAAYIGGLLWNL